MHELDYDFADKARELGFHVNDAGGLHLSIYLHGNHVITIQRLEKDCPWRIVAPYPPKISAEEFVDLLTKSLHTHK
jgi:hypothetical protein